MVTSAAWAPLYVLATICPLDGVEGQGPLSNRQRPEFASLVLLFPSFFPTALPRQCFLCALLFARFQVVGMTLHFLDDVILLHLALEAAEGVFHAFALLQPNFSHPTTPPNQSSRHLSVWQVSGAKSRGFRAIFVPKTGTGTVTLAQRRILNNSLQGNMAGRNACAADQSRHFAAATDLDPTRIRTLLARRTESVAEHRRSSE